MVTLKIPKVLEVHCGGQAEISCPATSLSGLLAHVEQQHPDLYRSLCSESGRPRRHIQLFRGDGGRLNGADTNAALRPGETILVFQAVSGG